MGSILLAVMPRSGTCNQNKTHHAAQLRILIAQFQAGKAAATMRAKHDGCSLHL